MLAYVFVYWLKKKISFKIELVRPKILHDLTWTNFCKSKKDNLEKISTEKQQSDRRWLIEVVYAMESLQPVIYLLFLHWSISHEEPN